jgi:two-component system, chemotaxis family, chemotaxis protein CheY
MLNFLLMIRVHPAEGQKTMSGLEYVQVLIVDDNRQMRTLVKALLRAFGLRRCLETGDAAEALEILRTAPVDLIITDFLMQPIDGVEYTRMVRRAPDSSNPFVPIIMMTGFSERSKVRMARDAGVNSFLVKPISAKSLQDHLTAAVLDPRPFVRSASYFGPDRRSVHDPKYAGPLRRMTDQSDGLNLDAVG